MRRVLAGYAILAAFAAVLSAQCVSLTSSSAYTQNFDGLASSGTANTVLPAGWAFSETGANANTTYRAGTGSDTTGDTYSFGAASSSDRAFGTLLSGSLAPTIGACFTNHTGGNIAVSISYTGEEWRLGAAGRTDKLDFQYSTDATSLTTGNWTNFDALDFVTPNTATTGAHDGNAAVNRTQRTGSLPVTLANGATLFIRWQDSDVSGSDDGLAVDDFTLTPLAAANPAGTGSATPATLERGTTQTLLAVAVSPGSNPPSTGLAVKADLTAIGGSSSQVFFDDGTNGDAASGDNTFSFRTALPTTVLPGLKTLPVTITDAQGRSGSATILLTVTCSFTGPVGPIQGPGSRSPYEGCSVTTSGIVTGRKSNGFFVQSAPDGDLLTSDGIFVFTSSAPTAVIGDSVQVSGRVQEFVPSADPNSPPATEIISPVVATLSTGNALPAPVTLTVADTNPAGGPDVLEKYEGMRVHVDVLNVVAPTGGSQNTTEEQNAIAFSNGVFYGVLPGIARPFREAGIVVGDPLPAGAPASIPRFDNNPERVRVDTRSMLPSPLEVTSFATVANITGPLDYAFRAYTIVQEAASLPVVTGNITAVPVPPALSTEVTVSSFNMERFFDTVDDPGISDVALTPTAFANRLNKASLAIRNVLRYPDVLGVEEMENLRTLQAVATKVNNDAVAAGDPNPNYHAFLEEGNDPGGIDVGFLVKTPRVTVSSVTQVGKTTTYLNPNNNQQELMNDRPPLVLRATAALPGGTSIPFTVVVNHLRSLDGIDDPVDGARIRAKREAQAEFLANLIQSVQASEPLISMGDYNAFEVNDGYVDVMGAIRGNPVPASQVVLASPPGLASPALTDLLGKVPDPQQRYSYVFDGDAQTLDHALATSLLLPRVTRFAYARNDADFPESYRADPNRSERISDHDIPVAYLNLAPVTDISSQFTLKMSSLGRDPHTPYFSGTVKLQNNGGATNGPVSVVFAGLKPGVNIVNATGTYQGNPYVTIPGTDGGIAAGASLTFEVQYDSTPNNILQADKVIYSGPLQ
jgi:predicted extracellular nuclease